MIVKTEAICLKNTRYGETSVISKMYTLEYGLSSYIIQGISRKSSTIKPSHIAPGNILELVIYQKPHSTLQRVKELKALGSLIDIHTDMIKSSILQFIIEIIAKTNEEDHKDPVVFNFIKSTVLDLEKSSAQLAYFPLYFLCRYLKFSGWFPNLEIWQNRYVFNIKEGKFGPTNVLNASDELDIDLSHQLYCLLHALENDLSLNMIQLSFRKALFNAILLYYEFHILKGKRIKSPAILAEVLS